MAPLPMYQRSRAASMRPKAMASSGSASPSLLTRLRSSSAARGLAARLGARAMSACWRSRRANARSKYACSYGRSGCISPTLPTPRWLTPDPPRVPEPTHAVAEEHYRRRAILAGVNFPLSAARCSDFARAEDLDPAGTAGSYAGFGVVELPLPWPRDVGAQPEVAPAAAALAA